MGGVRVTTYKLSGTCIAPFTLVHFPLRQSRDCVFSETGTFSLVDQAEVRIHFATTPVKYAALRDKLFSEYVR